LTPASSGEDVDPVDIEGALDRIAAAFQTTADRRSHALRITPESEDHERLPMLGQTVTPRHAFRTHRGLANGLGRAAHRQQDIYVRTEWMV